jgi:hypothetical protein
MLHAFSCKHLNVNVKVLGLWLGGLAVLQRMWNTMLKTTQWMIPAYHQHWMGTLVCPLVKIFLMKNKLQRRVAHGIMSLTLNPDPNPKQ